MNMASLSPLGMGGRRGPRAYNPLMDPELYAGSSTNNPSAGVRVTFFGNTTLLVSDGATHLLVDGFFSRPGPLETLLGKISPDREVIREELRRPALSKVDAIFVGHSHYDHALDAPVVAQMTGAVAVGSKSYRFIHQGAGGRTDSANLITLSAEREEHAFGRFLVTFVRSDHVSSHSFVQRMAEGEITRPVKIPARFSDFNCGGIYAIHIAHPDGAVAVTTTAGARAGQFRSLRADAIFLGIGLLAKEPESKRDFYWRETVEALDPTVVIPVRWDDFNRPLSRGLMPRSLVADDVKGALDWLKAKRGTRRLQVMDANDVFVVHGDTPA